MSDGERARIGQICLSFDRAKAKNSQLEGRGGASHYKQRHRHQHYSLSTFSFALMRLRLVP